MIKSLLIANRGEIACRIIRTARAMGIRSVAVYSDADAKALHVRQADEAVHIGASPATESYLVGEKIIAAAKETGAEAIHPGYGFLSENADFAQAVIDAGLIWVGPKPASIRAMGLKDSAKKLMEAAGVPTTPGYIGGVNDKKGQDPEHLAEQAELIGYPVLIKAVAGGGGKGMRKVDAAADFADSLISCQREAASSFGNAVVLIEKWIESPRHIEVQVFGDSHGNVVHLFERDCSLQRRHQKVIEEAPAPGMDAATRESICAAAVRAAKAVDYEGAGTIEFIADASNGLRATHIWFMEMNTRLQVEHPVTEEITGVDLVEWQLRVASGEKLPKKQDELSINGWAIEARLYAENPLTGFLPSIGRLDRFHLPDIIRSSLWRDPVRGVEYENDYPGTGRIETGVVEGGEVSSFYDPMIAKIICHADERREAALGLAHLVGDAQVWPVQTNATFLHALLVDPDFMRGDVSTGFIEQHHDDVVFEMEPPQWLLDPVAERMTSLTERAAGIGFRLNATTRTDIRMMDRATEYVGMLERDTPYDQRAYPVLTDATDGIFATLQGATWKFGIPETRGNSAGAASDGAILSPMPGKIIAVEVTAGQAVAKGDRLVTLEAMKMEHSLVAPFDGTVAQLNAELGEQVSEGTVLAEIDAGEDKAE